MAEISVSEKSYRVALASSDGKNVDEHYGRARKFYIYLINDQEGYEFVEERNARPPCMGASHMILEMDKSAKNFSDCKYVGASRIGSGASSTLSAHGIISIEVPGSVEEAILKIWKYDQAQSLFKQ